MVLYEEQLKEAAMDMEETLPGEKGLVKSKSRSSKSTNGKKGKCFCLYGAQSSKTQNFDNTQLVETHIHVAEESNQWALVASSNKPSAYP